MKLRFLSTSLLLLFSLTLFNCCKKYEEKVVPDNVAPPDFTVSSVIMETYVNKVYISVLGRKPLESEYNSGFQTIRGGNLSDSTRSIFLNDVMSKAEYYPHIYNLARQDLLNDLDTAEITNMILLFTSFLPLPEYADYVEQLQKEIDRLVAVRQIPTHIAGGSPYAIADMHQRLVNNYFYDQLNMGTFNFVTSSFEHFLYRSPTESELSGASKMVDGMVGTLFFNSGKTKDEYLNIFFHLGIDYYQGQVRTLFQRYLFRDPSSEETAQLAAKYKASGDYKQLQKDILSMDEFVGLEKQTN